MKNGTPDISGGQLRRLYDDWIDRQYGVAPKEGGPEVKRQRCLTIAGKQIACVQDKAKIGPGMLAAAALVLVLLVRR